MEKIIISLTNGNVAVWDKDEWDNYHYDGKFFIIKKDGMWVGFYNLDHIMSIILK